MKESISNILQHPWLTKKRKIMLGALLVFATFSSAYKWSAGGSFDAGSAVSSRGPYVRAGSLICNDLGSVAQLRMQKLAGINSAVDGCSRININLYVNLHNSQNGFIEVSNSGGSGWVSENDLEY